VPETKVMMPIGFIQQRKLTVWLSVPSVIAMGQRLGQLAPGSLPSVRISQFGGEGVSLSLAQAWQAAAPNSVVDNQYGPTECAVGCLSYRLSDKPVLTAERGTLSIGRPFPGMEAATVDADMNFLGANEIGELAMQGPQLALGYLGDEAKTAARFRMLNHPRLGMTRWYLTGDLAYFDESGQFHCLGRSDNQVKVMGHRVELEEVEAHLRNVCKSEAVAAVAWPLVNGNASGIVAFVSGVGLDGSMVREELRVRVPHYMLPSKVMSLETMPLSTNGKIDRQALRQMLEKPAVVVTVSKTANRSLVRET
jgi:acyl-coenzyme A synthetase/AMP-(fatty) acid ligase